MFLNRSPSRVAEATPAEAHERVVHGDGVLVDVREPNDGAHTATYDAILSRNPAAACAAAAAHLAGMAAWLQAIAHPGSTGERRPTGR